MKNTAIKFHRQGHFLTAGGYTIRHNFTTDSYEVYGNGMDKKHFGFLRDARALVIRMLEG